MRASMMFFALVAGCAGAQSGRVCTPITSWAAPAYRCEATQMVAVAQPEEPVKRGIEVDGDQILIGNRVQFETDSAVLLPESETVLDEVATTIQGHPEITQIQVEGHTDARASDSYNMKLSSQRAESVRTYLVGKGIEASRLTARGFGETKPVADNDSDSGMLQNRRVELRIMGRKPAEAASR